MNAEIISRLITSLIFAVLGYVISSKVPPPKTSMSWLFCIIVLVLSGYIMVNGKLISVLGFTIYINNLLQGMLFGLIAGFIIRKSPSKT